MLIYKIHENSTMEREKKTCLFVLFQQLLISELSWATGGNFGCFLIHSSQGVHLYAPTDKEILHLKCSFPTFKGDLFSFLNFSWIINLVFLLFLKAAKRYEYKLTTEVTSAYSMATTSHFNPHFAPLTAMFDKCYICRELWTMP